MVTECDVTRSQLKGEAFQEQRFLWERGVSLGADFDLSNFQDLLHAQKQI